MAFQCTSPSYNGVAVQSRNSDVETAPFIDSVRDAEVSGSRKGKYFAGFALITGCLVAAFTFSYQGHGPLAGKVKDIVEKTKVSLPEPFLLDALPDGVCQGDSFADHGGYDCAAPWVYCTDARCDSELTEKNGVLVARCACWMPKNSSLSGKIPSPNVSIAPKTTSGAGCVYNQAGSYPFGKDAIGGKGMCDAMKDGKLISTYGPLGHAPPARAVKCAPKTKWAWCWGAPCERVDGQIFCDCPIVISNYDTYDQYVSVSANVCKEEEGLEEDPCKHIHNGSPAGEAPMGHMQQCTR